MNARTRRGLNLKETCRWNIFREERRSGCAASRKAVQSCEIPRAGYKESIPKKMDFFYFIG